MNGSNEGSLAPVPSARLFYIMSLEWRNDLLLLFVADWLTLMILTVLWCELYCCWILSDLNSILFKLVWSRLSRALIFIHYFPWKCKLWGIRKEVRETNSRLEDAIAFLVVRRKALEAQVSMWSGHCCYISIFIRDLDINRYYFLSSFHSQTMKRKSVKEKEKYIHSIRDDTIIELFLIQFISFSYFCYFISIFDYLFCLYFRQNSLQYLIFLFSFLFAIK